MKNWIAFLRRAKNRIVSFLGFNYSSPAPENRFLGFFYPGHFYTPIPDPEFVDENAESLFNLEVDDIPGISLNTEKQLNVNNSILEFKDEYKPAATHEEALIRGERYFFRNPFFDAYDAFVYYGLLRLYSPRKVCEVGSGFSSALALDVCEKFVNPFPSFTFIEPDLERLNQLLTGKERGKIQVIEKPVQKVSDQLFESLNAGDFLFIDSSHCSKVGSDVNYLLLDIMPILKSGVIVHIHDVFWPFEYPKEWFDEGRCWNEAYLLRALLTNAQRYSILHFNSYLAMRHPSATSALPDWGIPGKAQSLWLEIQ